MTNESSLPLLERLLACAHCGSAATYRHSGPFAPEIAQTTHIECSNRDCGAKIARALPPEPVVAAWNRRTTPQFDVEKVAERIWRAVNGNAAMTDAGHGSFCDDDPKLCSIYEVIADELQKIINGGE